MGESLKARDTDRRPLEPPTFAPPPEMRAGYLTRRKGELDGLRRSAGLDEWKPVLDKVNHVRGTGAMFGFVGIGGLAEELVRAIQNDDPSRRELMARYAKAVEEAYV